MLVILSFVANVDMSVMVSLVAEDVLLIMAGYLGSTTIAPMKYFWWLTSVFFTGEAASKKTSLPPSLPPPRRPDFFPS
jgi:bacteriorhodopsin